MPRLNAGPATPWALLWLGGIGIGAWIPLLLSDLLSLSRPPVHPSKTLSALTDTPSPQPISPQFPIFLQQADRSAGSPTGKKFPTDNPSEQISGLRSRPWSISENSQLPQPSGEAPPQSNPGTWRPAKEKLPGSVLLGGPLGLESLREKAMVPAARTEKTLRSMNSDRLSVVPNHWRAAMQALVKGSDHVLPAEVVRLPAPRVTVAEEYPMVVKSDGVAETVVSPTKTSKEYLERWAERQSPVPEGSVRPVMVVLEPMETELNTDVSEQKERDF